jgi:hypothetical protein
MASGAATTAHPYKPFGWKLDHTEFARRRGLATVRHAEIGPGRTVMPRSPRTVSSSDWIEEIADEIATIATGLFKRLLADGRWCSMFPRAAYVTNGSLYS